jgi:large subunit ribosomal protein L28
MLPQLPQVALHDLLEVIGLEPTGRRHGVGSIRRVPGRPSRTPSQDWYPPGVPEEVSSVSYVCEICGKHPWVGKQVSFSHKRSSKRWLPNIQRVRIKHGSNSRRARVCTSCLKAGKVEKV